MVLGNTLFNIIFLPQEQVFQSRTAKVLGSVEEVAGFVEEMNFGESRDLKLTAGGVTGSL